MTMPTFGRMLYLIRRAAGWTQDKLALSLGVDRSLISRWEHDEWEGSSGKAFPLPHLKGLIEALYGISPRLQTEAQVRAWVELAGQPWSRLANWWVTLAAHRPRPGYRMPSPWGPVPPAQWRPPRPLSWWSWKPRPAALRWPCARPGKD